MKLTDAKIEDGAFYIYLKKKKKMIILKWF